MIPASHALVTLKPARQAALQAILTVESSRVLGARLPALPHVRTFLRVPTGSSRINSAVAQRIPGLFWQSNNRLTTLKQVEEALDMLIASGGEICPSPLCQDVQAELFPEVVHSRKGRRDHRGKIRVTRQYRREARQIEHACLRRQNLLAQAATDLNFQSPETVGGWYTRWRDEFDANELAPAFWRWQTRFSSLKELAWLRYGDDPLWAVMHEIRYIVSETPHSVREAERWQVPNKLRHMAGQ
jgi:hypothetical protein